MRFDIHTDGHDGAASRLVEELTALGFEARRVRAPEPGPPDVVALSIADRGRPAPLDGAAGTIAPGATARMVEAALCLAPLDFDALPLLVEGDSKLIRSWTPAVVVERFKPTVYSYTHNRYGTALGSETVRARFSAEVFRRMEALDGTSPQAPRSAYLALREDPAGPLVVQRRVTSCNLEVRVKRYHIGSPLHRYRFTEQHPTTQAGGPLRRWSRFDAPVVCFDWRHPLTDEQGTRLADEPISDDYAAVWMEDVPHAKEMARRCFVWLEELFAASGLLLVDLCFLIDRSGRLLYGEISPDCMRIRRAVAGAGPETADALDKDVWRQGSSGEQVAARYQELFERMFGAGAPP